VGQGVARRRVERPLNRGDRVGADPASAPPCGAADRVGGGVARQAAAPALGRSGNPSGNPDEKRRPRGSAFACNLGAF
jgi:hypothetical protein